MAGAALEVVVVPLPISGCGMRLGVITPHSYSILSISVCTCSSISQTGRALVLATQEIPDYAKMATRHTKVTISAMSAITDGQTKPQ